MFLVYFIQVNAGVVLMIQPSFWKGMRSLVDVQTSVITTAPVQLGSVWGRTLLTLCMLSVSREPGTKARLFIGELNF